MGDSARSCAHAHAQTPPILAGRLLGPGFRYLGRQGSQAHHGCKGHPGPRKPRRRGPRGVVTKSALRGTARRGAERACVTRGCVCVWSGVCVCVDVCACVSACMCLLVRACCVCVCARVCVSCVSCVCVYARAPEFVCARIFCLVWTRRSSRLGPRPYTAALRIDSLLETAPGVRDCSCTQAHGAARSG